MSLVGSKEKCKHCDSPMEFYSEDGLLVGTHTACPKLVGDILEKNKNKDILVQAEIDGLGSMLHSVQKDCIDRTKRLKKIKEIIEIVDNRCMAADGPVTPTKDEITDKELKEIYKLTQWEK